MTRRRATPKTGVAAKRVAAEPACQENKTSTAVSWYMDQRPLYEQLAHKVEAVVGEVLDAEGLQYHSITSRAKTVQSFATKADKDQYSDPEKQITDMAGVRIIAYVDSQARQIAEVVERLFDIDRDHSSDTSARLGVDKVGYRALHYVARLSQDRCRLPEYRRFEGLEFEIQVRTILQHAWAEIEHDRNYKFAGVLPEDIQRRFAILAGVLEMADREFDGVASAIDGYAATVAEKAEKGELDIPINTTSLREYMLTKFRDAVGAGLRPVFGWSDSDASQIVGELADFHISTLAELDSIVPTELATKVDVLRDYNFVGVLRAAMVIHDPDRYFVKAWAGHWGVVDPFGTRLLEAYGVDIEGLAARYSLLVERPPAKEP